VLRVSVSNKDLSALQISTGVRPIEFQPGAPAQVLVKSSGAVDKVEEYLKTALPPQIQIAVDASSSLFGEDPDMQAVLRFQRGSEPQGQDQMIRYPLEKPRYLSEWTRENYLEIPTEQWSKLLCRHKCRSSASRRNADIPLRTRRRRSLVNAPPPSLSVET
jgi:hypothetical protein